MCLIVSSCQLASEPHHGFGCRRFILNLNQFVHQNLGHSAITLNMYCLRLVDISCITFDWRLRRDEEVRILLFLEIFYVMRKDLLVQELIKLIKIYIQRLNGYLGCMRRASEWPGRWFYWFHDVNWAIFKRGTYSYWSELIRISQNWSGLFRTSQDWSGHERSGHIGTGYGRSGQDRKGLDRTKQVSVGQDWKGHVRLG